MQFLRRRGMGGFLPASVLAFAAILHKAGWGDVIVAFLCGWFVGGLEVGWWLLCSLVFAWGQVFVGVFLRKPVKRVPFVTWMIVGMWVWLAIRAFRYSF
ncbi:hypothetical protein [Thermospira aquatica]|uniref:Uncharacterized protein n=1 Tax=Thermospira aquatica TaxID=2828656 RepID=A0AAX3BFH2_9SPIR|nr:hypothetical protein [Thermospira aquatica]URA10976.1 hypothetical protein KDW03_04005 [Thermospira aquatica]